MGDGAPDAAFEYDVARAAQAPNLIDIRAKDTRELKRLRPPAMGIQFNLSMGALCSTPHPTRGTVQNALPLVQDSLRQCGQRRGRLVGDTLRRECWFIERQFDRGITHINQQPRL